MNKAYPNSIKLILLDRDGVINIDSPDYIKSPAEWHPIPGALHAIKLLQGKFDVIVCSNQSGLGRGLFSHATLAAVHDKMNLELQNIGALPLQVLFCPHLPNENCDCRKPSAGLLAEAMSIAKASSEETIFIGDSEKDLLAAEHAGCYAALVLTGNGSKSQSTKIGIRTPHFANLAAAAEQLVNL